MALPAYVASGTLSTGNSVAYPASVAANELALLEYVLKYPETPCTVNTPSGWTPIGAAVTGGAGAQGVGTGNVSKTWFVKVMAGTEGGTSLTTALTGTANSRIARISTFSISAGASWDYSSYTSGTDSSSGVGYSAAGGADISLQVNDLLVAGCGINANIGFSAHAFAATGCTFGTVTERVDSSSAAGDDCAMSLATGGVTAGPSSSAPTYSCTLGGAGGAGPAIMLRLREVTNVDTTGIATAEAFGTAIADHAIDFSGVATAEAFGTFSTLTALDATGIATAEAFGTATADHAIDATAIAGAEAFGTATLDHSIDGAGVASSEAFGTATIETFVDGAGVASSEAFGAATMDHAVDAAGIASGEAFGTPAIVYVIAETGIASAEAFGTARFTRFAYFETYSATVEVDDNTATVEFDIMPYVIKAGDLLPILAGTITLPAGIDLTDVDLFATYRGRTTEARTVAVTNDGLADGSPTLDSGEPTVWRWHYNWQDGDTDDADVYEFGISGEVGGLQMTFPNDQWSTFYIRAQLTDDPVP